MGDTLALLSITVYHSIKKAVRRITVQYSISALLAYSN